MRHLRAMSDFKLNSLKAVIFLLKCLIVFCANILLTLSVPMHKTRHNVEHTNMENLVFRGTYRVHSEDSSLCNSVCSKISLSIGHKFIWRFDKNAQECKCLEAVKLDYFRYNEVMDLAEFIYHRMTFILCKCGSFLFVPPPA